MYKKNYTSWTSEIYPRYMSDLTFKNQLYSTPQQAKKEKIYIHYHIKRFRRNIWQNSIFYCDKNF